MAARSRTFFRSAQVLGVCLISGYVLLVQWAAQGSSYDAWGALVAIPLLVLVSIPLILRAGRIDPSKTFLRLLVAAFIVKALATVARYYMTFVMYDGVGDAAGYDGHGERLAPHFRAGEFDADLEKPLIGTGFIRALTGLIYALTGPSIYVAYAVFAWFGFWGLYFLYRAFQVGIPDGNHRRYAVLVLFLPSMLFWPAGLGKEAWMTLGIGLAAFGAAQLLTGRGHWLLPLLSGMTATALVRPHITAALFAGIAVAVVVRRSHRPSTSLTPLIRTVVIVGVLGASFVVVGRTAAYLGIEDVSVQGIQSERSDIFANTSQGGSEFDADPVNSPIEMPWAVVSVLFRPFIFEVDSAQAMIAAAEGTLLLALAALSLRRWRTVLGQFRDQPYLIVCLVYTLLFVYAFSSFSNFGILARQRVQVLPFVLVFLALPLIKRRPVHEGNRHTHEEISV